MSIVTKLCIKMNAEQEESSRQKIIKLTSRLNSRLERMEDLYKEVLPIKFSDFVSIQDAEELIRYFSFKNRGILDFRCGIKSYITIRPKFQT